MVFEPQNIETYVVQWLKTATKGNVSVTFAFATDRMHLHCKVCHSEHICNQPKVSNEIDYSCQEFVKLHAHAGGHKTELSTELVQNLDGTYTRTKRYTDGSYATDICQWGDVAPMSIDFKKVGLVDEKLSMAGVIHDQMKKYEAELEEKFKSQAIANKIKVLQLGDKEQAEKEKAKWDAYKEKLVDESDVMMAQKAHQFFTQQFKDVLTKQLFKPLPVGQESSLENHPTPTSKKDKPLKRVEGRRFR